MLTEFTPIASTVGGALIGLSAGLYMLFNGRIAGISGLVAQLLPPFGNKAIGVPLAFVLGLLLAPVLWWLSQGSWPAQTVSSDPLRMAAAGLLVGLGTTLGNGCTSGHGVCGLARLSFRSLIAVIVFMAVAAFVVFLDRHLL
jgi:uncharacterized protein